MILTKLTSIIVSLIITLSSQLAVPGFRIELPQKDPGKNTNSQQIVSLSLADTNAPKSEVLGVSTISEQELQLEKKRQDIEYFYQNLEAEYKDAKQKWYEVENLTQYLSNQGSPVATPKYAQQIIQVSRENGADYKIIVAIMGVESGFCRVPYKDYNCFGYLNGAQYSSFEHAFGDLIPRIANEYANVYGTDFEAFADAYGIHNLKVHVPRLQAFYNGLK